MLQVFDEIIELFDFDVAVDDVAWVQEAKCLDVLFDSLVIFFLLEKLVGMLFGDLLDDLGRESSLFCDSYRDFILLLLDECIDLIVDVLRAKTDELSFDLSCLDIPEL